MYTEDNYPYNYLENGTLKGITPDLFEKITETMRDRVSRERIRLVPWSEGYQAALTGNNTMIFAIARIPSRETSFKWAGPIYPYTTVVFARPDSGIIIKSPDNLKPYRIGVVADDAAIQPLVDAGVNRSHIVEVPEEYMLIDQIRNGTIDLWADSEISGRVLAREMTGNAYSFRVVHRFPEIPVYFGFSRDVPDTTVQSSQHALDTLKEEKSDQAISSYDTIIGRYIPSVGLAPIIVNRMIEKIRELKDRYGLTVLMAEQNFAQAVKIADRGYVIVHGRIAHAGTAAELNDSDLIRRFYLGL